jgi:predicted nucleotide-binding protein (sugar kinase/HSP70/actin superfamily)
MIKMIHMGGGVFKPLTPQDEESLRRFKVGDVMEVNPTKVRNPKFHAKFFAMLNVGYDAFEPVVEYKGEVVRKNFDKFRSDITILAGYYTIEVGVKMEPIAVAKSISFASMNDDEFEKLYSDVADVLLTRVLTNYTRENLDNVVQQIMGFV